MSGAGYCGSCGAALESGAAFCAGCGAQVVTEPASNAYAPPAQPPADRPMQQQPIVPPAAYPVAGVAAPTAVPKKKSGGCVTALVSVVVIVLLVGAGVIAYFSGVFHTEKPKQPPALPKAVAGTLTEFPVDLSSTGAVKPVSVSTKTLDPASKAELEPKAMPPGVTSQVLMSAGGKTVTSAVYKSKPQDNPVYVNVMDTTGGSAEAASEVSRTIAANSPGAEATGIRLQSQTGVGYEGFKVKSPQIEVYILGKANTGTVIIIYAPDPTTMSIAERLAPTVGSGAGLNADPGFTSVVSNLPAQLPAGMELTEMSTYDGSDLNASIQQLGQSLGVQGGDTQRLIAQAQPFMPQQLVISRYRDASGADFNLMVGDYGSALSAWKTWLLLRATAGMSNMQSIKVHDTNGLTVTQDQQQILIFQTGSHLALLTGPVRPAGSPLMDLAEAIQF